MELGIKTIAFSADSEATAKSTIAKHNIRFPIGHSAKVAEVLGCDTNDNPRALQTTDFLLAPDGSVINAVYSSLAIGRLAPDDVAAYVRPKM